MPYILEPFIELGIWIGAALIRKAGDILIHIENVAGRR